MAKMAILVDGGFYRVRIRAINGRTAQTPQDLATELVDYCAKQAILEGRKTVAQLTRQDLKLDMGQKGVDMRLGLDLVSLALKRLVDQVVVITGDSDFVPAIKIARTEGVEVILDPMGQHIADDLQEHIDRIRTV